MWRTALRDAALQRKPVPPTCGMPLGSGLRRDSGFGMQAEVDKGIGRRL
jgi:hypothetical protein